MNARTWLTISVTVNLMCVVALVWLLTRPAPPESAKSAPRSETITAALPSAATTAPPGTVALAWRDSMAQLRQAGVPSAIIAKVVVEKIAQKWTPLETQFERQYLNDEIDTKRLAELHDERAQEEERELHAALGDGYREWHKEHVVQNMYLGGLMPAEEQKEPLYTLETEWRKRLHELEVAKRNGQLDPAAFDAAHATAEADYKRQLAAIIGDERVYGDPTANQPGDELRREFSQLQLTDAHVGELAAVQKKWSETRAAMAASLAKTGTMDGAYEGDLQAIDRARDEEYRRILGEEAFNHWQRNRDDRYRVMRNNAESWGLDRQQVDRVYETLRSYDLAAATFEHQAQVREQSGQAVDWATVEQSLSAYARQTEAALRAQLGDERFDKMKAQAVFDFRQPNPARYDPNVRAPIK